MKANSRRRVLISSVAMLLVAIVALGTSTFAWFTAQPTATASNMSVKTTKSSGIVVKTEDASTFTTDSKWADSRKNVALSPASILMTGTATNNAWYIAPQANADGTAIKTEMTAEALADISASYALKTSFQVKTLDEVTEKEVSCLINVTNGNTVMPYLRVAVLDNANKVLGVWAQDAVDTSAVTSAGAAGAFTVDTYKSTTAAFDLGKVSTAKTFNVYVWLEGQDTDCIDPSAAEITATDISFTLRDKSMS